MRGVAYDKAALDEMVLRTRNPYYRIVGQKGAMFCGIASGLVRVVRCVLRDQNTVKQAFLRNQLAFHAQYQQFAAESALRCPRVNLVSAGLSRLRQGTFSGRNMFSSGIWLAARIA